MTRFQLNCSSLLEQFDFDLAKEGRRESISGMGFVVKVHLVSADSQFSYRLDFDIKTDGSGEGGGCIEGRKAFLVVEDLSWQLLTIESS